VLDAAPGREPGLRESGTSEHIKEAFRLAGLDSNLTERGYAALQELLERRDAVEHPKKANVFNSHSRDWDRVPLSWSLTTSPSGI
jgi:hypothetical protein